MQGGAVCDAGLKCAFSLQESSISNEIVYIDVVADPGTVTPLIEGCAQITTFFFFKDLEIIAILLIK